MKGFMLNKLVLVAGALLFAIGVIGYLMPETESKEPVRIFYPSTGGDVLFTHQKHEKLKNLKCEDCHHEHLSSDNIFKCDKCHEDGYSAEDLNHEEMVEYHGYSCTRCHKSEKKEFLACRKCHKETGEAKKVSCERCHAEEGYDPVDFSHSELEEIEGHWCNECHQSRSSSDAIHKQCDRCHRKIENSTFLKNVERDESAGCALCHLKS